MHPGWQSIIDFERAILELRALTGWTEETAMMNAAKHAEAYMPNAEPVIVVRALSNLVRSGAVRSAVW